MIVNKKLDRFKQWAGERMGGEVKTNTTDNFKALEQEMDLRHQGMEKMQQSMSIYMKAVSKKAELEKKEKTLPIAYLGSTMITHADDFEHDAQYGQCLSTFGRTQERLGHAQDSYIVAATNTWADSLERSLVQMKEYQAARKKLDSRRLAYDTSLAKMQKAKKEDFRVEEELRSQQLKYEEAEADVERRMFEIKDAENESVTDLTAFLEAQLAYHDRCREALLELQNEWPARQAFGQQIAPRPAPRPRSNTVRSYMSTHSEKEEPPAQPPRPIIQSRATSYSQRYGELSNGADRPVSRPGVNRSNTYQQEAHARRDLSPVNPSPRISRAPSDSMMIQSQLSSLRRVDTNASQRDVFADESPLYGAGSVSPQTPQSTGSETPLAGGRRAPPPPPPSRASKPGLGKPAPPPPPAKRTLIA